MTSRDRRTDENARSDGTFRRKRETTRTNQNAEADRPPGGSDPLSAPVRPDLGAAHTPAPPGNRPAPREPHPLDDPRRKPRNRPRQTSCPTPAARPGAPTCGSAPRPIARRGAPRRPSADYRFRSRSGAASFSRSATSRSCSSRRSRASRANFFSSSA